MGIGVKGLSIIVLTLLVYTVLTPIVVYGTSVCGLFSKGDKLTYEMVHRTELGVYREYYTVRFEDVFQSSQGMMYIMRIEYHGVSDREKKISAPCYNLPDYVPALIEDINDFKAKGVGSVSEPLPLFDLIPPSGKEVVTYTTIRVSLVSSTEYVLNISKGKYSIRALMVRGKYKEYDVEGFITDNTGLLLKLSFIDRYSRRVVYEVELDYFSSMDKLVGGGTGGSSVGGFNIWDYLPMIFIVALVIVSIIIIVIVIRRVTRIIGY